VVWRWSGGQKWSGKCQELEVLSYSRWFWRLDPGNHGKSRDFRLFRVFSGFSGNPGIFDFFGFFRDFRLFRSCFCVGRESGGEGPKSAIPEKTCTWGCTQKQAFSGLFLGGGLGPGGGLQKVRFSGFSRWIWPWRDLRGGTPPSLQYYIDHCWCRPLNKCPAKIWGCFFNLLCCSPRETPPEAKKTQNQA